MPRGPRVLAPTAAEKPTVEGSMIIEKIMQSSSELAACDAWRRFKSDGKSHGGPAEVLRNALVDAVSATSWLTTEQCMTTRISEGKETPALRIVEGTVCVCVSLSHQRSRGKTGNGRGGGAQAGVWLQDEQASDSDHWVR